MNERNPLEIAGDNEINDKSNKGGRPTMDKAIKFTPQPKSLVISQMLNKLRTEMRSKNDFQEVDEPDLDQIDQEIIALPVQITKRSSPKTKKKRKHRTTAANIQHYSCDYPNCLYTCKLSCNLIKHKRIHTAEKPYLCDQCSFRSNFVNSLKVHKRTHTNERPYACLFCSYRCNSSSNLKKHCLHRHPEVPKI